MFYLTSEIFLILNKSYDSFTLCRVATYSFSLLYNVTLMNDFLFILLVTDICILNVCIYVCAFTCVQIQVSL